MVELDCHISTTNEDQPQCVIIRQQQHANRPQRGLLGDHKNNIFLLFLFFGSDNIIFFYFNLDFDFDLNLLISFWILILI